MGLFDTIRLRILVVVAASMIFQLCSDDQPELFTLNQEIEVHENKLIALELDQDQGRIDIQILDISESRCPSDVVCVRFGEAEVKVGMSGVEEILKTLDLCNGDCPQRNKGLIIADTVTVEIDGKDYGVILKDVVPFPMTTNQDVPKEAILEVISM